ncbi:MAG: hypothetical protein SPL39_05300 [Selenomonadaceae bacterium]|nr:hypothetical protein [Selenomonadaceae bacterium]
MDVSTMTRISQQTAALSGSYTKTSSTKTTTPDGQVTENTTSEAYTIDISAASQQAAKATKGLTADQVDVLKQGIEKSQQLMIQTLTQQNLKLQGYLDEGIGQLNFDGVLFGTDKFALPAVATTPEEAEKAVADGGDYSIDAVAGRILDMASTIANGDPEKLKAMQEAVEKGFEAAGISWKDTFGEDEDMPEITTKTHDEVTKRFADLYEQLTNPKTDETADTTKTSEM